MKPTETIDRLVADGIVDEIVQRVKTGKEAEVFVVRKGEDYFAAKVYKERHARNFRNNAGYREGRSVRNTRDMRAMAKGTTYGVERSESEWMLTEHDALMVVSAAGVRVPRAELFYEGVLLMELVLGADGQPAPRLIEIALDREEALAHHRDLVGQVIRMLTCDLIHGDLSPYNVLMAWNGPTIIDLPQVVKAAHNSQAEEFLVRDVRNLAEHFAKSAPELKKRLHDGYAIWKKYMARELTPDFWPEEGTVAPAREFVPAVPTGHRPQRPQGQGRPPGQGARPPGNGRPPGSPPASSPNAAATAPHAQRPVAQGAVPPGPGGQSPLAPGPSARSPSQGPSAPGQGRPHGRPQGQGRPPGQGRPHNDRPGGPRPDRPPDRSHGPSERPHDRREGKPPGHARPHDQKPLATPHEPRASHPPRGPRPQAPRPPQTAHAPSTGAPSSGPRPAGSREGQGGSRASGQHRRRPS